MSIITYSNISCNDANINNLTCTGSLTCANINITELLVNGITGQTITATNIYSTNATSSNIYGSIITGSNIYASGRITGAGGISTSTLYCPIITGTTIYASGIITGAGGISTGTLSCPTITATSIYASGIITGAGGISTGTLYCPTITATSIYASGIINSSNINGAFNFNNIFLSSNTITGSSSLAQLTSSMLYIRNGPTITLPSASGYTGMLFSARFLDMNGCTMGCVNSMITTVNPVNSIFLQPKGYLAKFYSDGNKWFQLNNNNILQNYLTISGGTRTSTILSNYNAINFNGGTGTFTTSNVITANFVVVGGGQNGVQNLDTYTGNGGNGGKVSYGTITLRPLITYTFKVATTNTSSFLTGSTGSINITANGGSTGSNGTCTGTDVSGAVFVGGVGGKSYFSTYGITDQSGGNGPFISNITRNYGGGGGSSFALGGAGGGGAGGGDGGAGFGIGGQAGTPNTGGGGGGGYQFLGSGSGAAGVIILYV